MEIDLIEYSGLEHRPLTPLQTLFVEAFFKYDGELSKVAKAIGRTTQHAHNINKSPLVQEVILLHTRKLAKNIGKRPDFKIEKTDRLKLLWNIANQGVELIYDKEGNQIMQSPATSVSAIRTINEMVVGSLAPKEVDVVVTVEDKRTEQEIRDNILALTAEYATLSNVTDDEVAKTRALPEIDDASLGLEVDEAESQELRAKH